MADATNAGTLIYDVEMNIAELIRSQHDINRNLTGTENRFSQFGGTISRIAGAITAALSVKQIADYANAWVDVNNKLVNSVKASESLADVTERVFAISQDTRSSLDATATLYGRLERATRSAGTSTEDLAKLTTTINKGLIVSGATTAEASSTMIQLSQALASGVLRGEEFNSISENGSRIAVALANSLGVTQGQLRAMAAQGQLTTDVVVKGLLSQGDAIAAEFGNTVTTMGQAFEVAGNNITKFVGESSTVRSTLSVFNDSVITLSENLETISTVIIAVSALLGARMAGALALATAEKIKSIAATQALVKAEVQSAQASQFAANAVVRKSIADKEAALSAMALAQAEYNVAKGSAAEAFALDNLIAKKSLAVAASADLVVAENALATATARSAAAASAASVSWGLARGALALVGGPTGVAFLAAAALFYFYQKAEEARKAAIELADGVNALIGKMKEMSNLQISAEIAKLRGTFTTLSQEVGEAQQQFNVASARVTRLQAEISRLDKGSSDYKNTQIKLVAAQDELAIAENDLVNARNRLGQATNGVSILQAQLNGQFKTGIDLLKRDGEQAGIAAGMMSRLGDMINFAGRAKDKFNATSLQVTRSVDADKILADLQQENKLLAIKDDRQRAIATASAEAMAKGAEAGSNQLRQIEDEAAKNYDLTQAKKESKKATSDAQKEENKAAAENARRVKQLDELKAGTEALTLTEQRRYREAAQAEAVTGLGKDATAAQIQQARDLAGQEFDIKQRINDRKAASDANYYAAADLKRQDDLDQTDRQLAAGLVTFEQAQARKAQIAADYQKTIAEATAEKAVTPQNALKGMVDPVQALANEHTKKLALIQQFETEKGSITQRGLELMNAANTQYEAQRTAAIYELWKSQSEVNNLLGTAFESLQSTASNALTGIITGTMSAQDAMRSLGSTLLNSVINSLIQMGVESLKNFVIGQTMGAAATAATVAEAATATAAWTPAAIAASIATMGAASTTGLAAYGTAQAAGKALSIAGARKNGGPVQAGSMYQVGEGGMPEIYQASSGKQYMIPGDNGKVISNKDMQGGGSPVVNLNIQNYTSANIDQRTTRGSDGSVTIDMIVADINNGGEIGQAIAYSHDAPRRARG